MRFFDILKRYNLIPRAAENAILFDASEIASEIDKIEKPEGGSYPRESYGICAPPFRDRFFWIEAITKPDPDHYKSPGDWEDMRDLGFSPEEVLQRAEQKRDHLVARGSLCIAYDWLESDSGKLYRESGEDYDNGRWIIDLYGFLAVYENIPTFEEVNPIPARAHIVIGRDGTLLSNPEHTLVESFVSDPESARISAMGITNLIPFTLLSLSFLHRRTEVDYITPNRLERKTAARRFGEKSGAAPLRDYYLLRIKPHIDHDSPLTDISRIRPLGTRGDKRSHSVRGHFRRVPESGLFGRGYNAGELIWIPDHMRGESSLGDVSKGYKITK